VAGSIPVRCTEAGAMTTVEAPGRVTDRPTGETAPEKVTAPVIRALHEATAMQKPGSSEARHRWQVPFYCYGLGVLAAAALFAACFVLGPAAFGIPAANASLAKHVSAALLLTAVILAGQKLAGILINRKTLDDNVIFFNLRLVVRLVAIILICLVFLSALSQTWYTLPVALGVFSVVTGFALQMPMASFIGWLYIVSRRPYRVGDRIKIASATGDVIDVSYFDTTLWEFGGQ